jgi:hypothetical protein
LGSDGDWRPAYRASDRSRMSRRSLLAGAAAIAGAGLSATASAEDKVSEQDAKYQSAPKGQQRCEICLQFEPPNQCKIVRGPIVSNGWCQFFAPRENAH